MSASAIRARRQARAIVMEAAASPLLQVRSLSTRFSTPRGRVHAVDNVSLELERGQTLGIVGESGSGKSVLARTIMRLNPPSAMVAGEVRFGGLDLLNADAETARTIWGAEISMIFQNPMTSLNPVVRIGRQIAEPLHFHLGMDWKDARARSIELLRQVGIPGPERRINDYPHSLSGGMRQRVCIAIALACSPRLILADEPTTALDVTIQRQVLDLLRTLQRDNGMAMVLITHDLGVVAGRTDRIMVMYGGRVVETGPTASLFTETRHPYTAALLASIPKLEQPSHTRLHVISGRPVDVVDPPAACRFAPRCPYAQPRCTMEDPVLSVATTPGHSFACFYPLGTPAAAEALATNRAAGRTAAGLPVASDEVGFDGR